MQRAAMLEIVRQGIDEYWSISMTRISSNIEPATLQGTVGGNPEADFNLLPDVRRQISFLFQPCESRVYAIVSPHVVGLLSATPA
jgi:hypothetical protein